MIAPIVNYLLRKRVNALDRQPSLVRGEHIMHVAIVAVFQQGDHFSWVEKYVKEWRKRGRRTVDLYLYFPHKKQMAHYHGGMKDMLFSSAQFNLLGKITDQKLLNSLQMEYDVLIDLSRGAHLSCDVLIAKSKAKWKAGEHSAKRAYLLDLMINTKGEHDIRNVIRHLDHYILNINTTQAA
jgi:hypothetical protein